MHLCEPQLRERVVCVFVRYASRWIRKYTDRSDNVLHLVGEAWSAFGMYFCHRTPSCKQDTSEMTWPLGRRYKNAFGSSLYLIFLIILKAKNQRIYNIYNILTNAKVSITFTNYDFIAYQKQNTWFNSHQNFF